MAYAALVSLEQTIADNLNHDDCSIFPFRKKMIISMNKNVALLKAFLEDYPEKVNNILEERMRELANHVEYFMEYFMWRRIRYDSMNWSPNVKFLFKFKKVAGQVDSMAAEVLGIEKVRLSEDYSSPAAAAAASSSLAPTHKRNATIGFDDDLLAIKELLCGEPSKLQVIPIVGMGGIGKTTLATNTYFDPLIVEHFHIRAWVTVSQDYSAEKVTSDLLTLMKESNTEESSRQSNEEKLHKSLKGRRYLIVMDDMWTTQAWDDVKRIFPDDDNGSRIILTTRLLDVAAYAESCGNLHEMHLMNIDQSWDLLQSKVFTHKEHCPSELEHIGKAISRSCRGLPLAIVVIGGLLSTMSRTRASWEEIADNVKSAISSTKDGHLEKILSLSYTHLPHHLRPCFLYMGAFPEDYETRASKLIKLWVAEGFIKSSVSSRSFEEMAEDYLEDLVKRSLVMVSQRKSDGRIKSCKVHDIMRELCIRKAHEDKFLVYVMGNNVSNIGIKNQRRLCLTQSRDLNELASICYGSTIRTIICFWQSEWSSCNLRYLRFLRVLDLEYASVGLFDPSLEHIAPLPEQVFELFHLRYLAVGGFLVKIPAGISKLQNLQTLIIRPRMMPTLLRRVVSLPLEIWRMPQLRHLVCFDFSGLPNPEEGGTSVLESLQTLWVVRNLTFTESIVQMIPSLKKLGIYYNSRKMTGQLENLVHLQQLEKLKLTVMEGLCSPTFPRTLKKLNLRGGRGLPWEDMMRNVGSLPNLEVLKIRDSYFRGGTWETSEGEFPVLKYLLIVRADLKQWITESSSHFPSLRCLRLRGCRRLPEIPDVIGDIPTLELIKIEGFNRSLWASAERIREEQRSWGNDVLQVRCIAF